MYIRANYLYMCASGNVRKWEMRKWDVRKKFVRKKLCPIFCVQVGRNRKIHNEQRERLLFLMYNRDALKITSRSTANFYEG